MLEFLFRVSLLVVVIFFPFSQERVIISGIPIYFHEIAIIFATAFFLFIGKKWILPSKWMIFSSVAIFFGVATSLFVHGVDDTGLGMLKSWFLFPMLYGFLLLQQLNDPLFREHFLRLWFAIAVLTAAVALFFPSGTQWTYDDRLQAFFPSPNHLGLFLAPGLLLGFSFLFRFLQEKRIGALAISFIGSVILAAAIFFSRSLTSIGAVMLSVIVLGMFAFVQYRIARTIILAAITISFVIALSYFLVYWQKFSTGEVRSSLASRVMIWNTSFGMIRENPIFGIGPGNFQETYLRYQSEFPPYLEWAVSHPHNILLAFWLNAGIIGLLGVIMLVFFVFRYLDRALMDSNDMKRKIFLSFLVAFFVLFFSQGTFDTPYFKNEFALFFWSFIALALSADKQQFDYYSLQLQRENK